jgi:DNA repair photolyase
LALGSNTDPYQPVERTLKLTRSVLEVLDRYNHPVGIVTKSSGVLRDLDILSSMAKRNLARVHISITTLDARLARVMEPRAATPARRLHAIAELSRAGVPSGVLAAPMIPALNDAEMEKILEASAKAGARHASYVLLRLPLELREMFEAWLHTHFPDRAGHVLSLIRQTRAGQLNDPRFHHRFAGQGVYADLLSRRFTRASRQFGFGEVRAQLDCDRFAVPGGTTEAAPSQLSLF